VAITEVQNKANKPGITTKSGSIKTQLIGSDIPYTARKYWIPTCRNDLEKNTFTPVQAEVLKENCEVSFIATHQKVLKRLTSSEKFRPEKIITLVF